MSGTTIAKSITFGLDLAVKIEKEAKVTHRSFSQMVEYILRSHYTEKDRPTSASQ